MKFHGQSFLGQTGGDVLMTGDPRGWPVLWTWPHSISPDKAFGLAKAECGLSESFLDAIWQSSGTALGWLILTDGCDYFWHGKHREGFRLRAEP